MMSFWCFIPRKYEAECLGILPLTNSDQSKSTDSLSHLDPLIILNALR